MKPILLTTPTEHLLRISPYCLAAWGSKMVEVNGATIRGSFVVLSSDPTPRAVLESPSEIDRLFEHATTAGSYGSAAGVVATQDALIRAQAEPQD